MSLFFVFLTALIPICLAKCLYSTKPANSSDIIRTAYPIGNGKTALLPYGPAGREILNINRDSLWSGGPFASTRYTGGNHGEKSHFLPGIRDWVFRNGTGNVTELMSESDNYGSYAVLGNLSVTIDGIEDASRYVRTLDLITGVHTTSYHIGQSIYTIFTYCSYPDDVCVYHVSSTQPLPSIHISMANTLTNTPLVKSTCSSGQVRLRGITQADIGMIYESITKVVGNNTSSRCSKDSLIVSPSKQNQLTLILAAGTSFDQSKGNAAAKYSFRGLDPHDYVQNAANEASSKSAQQLLETHVADYTPLASAFELNLPDTQNSAGLETADLVARYNTNGTAGDPYLESLTFDFARHLFISSSRNGSLPPNLQGRWSTGLSSAWSADYHANINIQMNHWGVDQTGLGELQTPLWEYMAQNWAPRGAETAKLLYNASGWVVHNEINIFGYTAMKNGSFEGQIWADYPIAAAWMMQHVWDYYEYSQDTTWLKETGYPMLKAIAKFWSSQLQKDRHYNDGSLVVNPCTSAEHGVTTFGCTHYQQLIHQVYETTLQAAAIVNERNKGFLSTLQTQVSALDKGLHIGSWGQIQEWKLDLDVKNDTHRHLSNLIGWYPGWSISSYANGYTNDTIRQAVETTLYSRGIGIAADANAGWAKVWRAACWARLNNAERAYYELRLTIAENWAANLFSMYSADQQPFQIDANFGFAGAVLSMLVVDLPVSISTAATTYGDPVRKVVLGPAIPAAWGNGSVRGLRLRGGGMVDFEWDGKGLVTTARLRGWKPAVEIVNREGKVLARQGI